MKKKKPIFILIISSVAIALILYAEVMRLTTSLYAEIEYYGVWGLVKQVIMDLFLIGCLIGYWNMKRWGVYGYCIYFLIDQVLPRTISFQQTAMSAEPYKDTYVHLVLIIIGFFYFKKMD